MKNTAKMWRRYTTGAAIALLIGFVLIRGTDFLIDIAVGLFKFLVIAGFALGFAFLLVTSLMKDKNKRPL